MSSRTRPRPLGRRKCAVARVSEDEIAKVAQSVRPSRLIEELEHLGVLRRIVFAEGPRSGSSGSSVVNQPRVSCRNWWKLISSGCVAIQARIFSSTQPASSYSSMSRLGNRPSWKPVISS